MFVFFLFFFIFFFQAEDGIRDRLVTGVQTCALPILQLTKKGYEFKAFDEFLTDWRLAKNSLSSSTFRKLIDGYNVYRKYLEQSILKSLINLLILSLNFLRKK